MKHEVVCTESYSARIVSSPAEIQSLLTAAKAASICRDPLVAPEFFLASLPKGWTPKIVAVRYGGDLRAMVYAKDRSLLRFFSLGIVHADLTSCVLAGTIEEQQAAVLVVIKTLLNAPGTRALRLRVRRNSPELRALRKFYGSSPLYFQFSRQRDHAALRLETTYERMLETFGYTTRRNLRYYRRRFELSGHVYLEQLGIDDMRSASAYLQPKCKVAGEPDSMQRFLKMVATAERPLAMGLRHRNGEWLSLACGVYTPAAGVLLMQLNNDHDFPRDSLSMTMRAYLIESLIRQGKQTLLFWGGTVAPMNRYASDLKSIKIDVDSPGYAWRSLGWAKNSLLPRMPQLGRWVERLVPVAKYPSGR